MSRHNHGGVAVVGKPGVRLTSVAFGPCPATFEMIAARATIGSESCVVVIYTPTWVSQWFGRSVDDLAQLYKTVLTQLADDFTPIKKVTRRPRQSDPWFDSYIVAQPSDSQGDLNELSPPLDVAWTTPRRSLVLLKRGRLNVAFIAAIYADRSDQRSGSRQWTPKTRTQGAFGSLSTRFLAVDLHQPMKRSTPIVFTDTWRTKSRLSAPRRSLRQCQTVSLIHQVSLRKFDPIECHEVTEAIQKLPNKNSAADPVPTSVLKQLADVVPFLTALFNRLMTEGVYRQYSNRRL